MKRSADSLVPARRTAPRRETDETRKDGPPTIDGIILLRAALWFTLRDVFSVLCVCKEWNKEMQRQTLWKHYCETLYPQSSRAFLAMQPNCDFQKLTKTLSTQDDVDTAPSHEFTPSAGLDNYFALVELYRVRDVEGVRQTTVEASFGCECEFSVPQNGESIPRGR